MKIVVRWRIACDSFCFITHFLFEITSKGHQACSNATSQNWGRHTCNVRGFSYVRSCAIGITPSCIQFSLQTQHCEYKKCTWPFSGKVRAARCNNGKPSSVVDVQRSERKVSLWKKKKKSVPLCRRSPLSDHIFPPLPLPICAIDGTCGMKLRYRMYVAQSNSDHVVVYTTTSRDSVVGFVTLKR